MARNRRQPHNSDGTFRSPDADPNDPVNPEPKKPRGFQKGVCPNPGGRPKHVKILRDLIGERTDNGVELIEFVLDVMRGQKEGMEAYQARTYAHEWLSDRYYGRPKVSVEVSPGEQAPVPPLQLREVLLALDDKDRADLERILGNLEQAKREGKLALPAAEPEDEQLH